MVCVIGNGSVGVMIFVLYILCTSFLQALRYVGIPGDGLGLYASAHLVEGVLVAHG